MPKQDQNSTNEMFEIRIARLEMFLQKMGFSIVETVDAPEEAPITAAEK